MTMLLVHVPSAGVVPVVVIDDHGQTLRVRLATRAIVQPPECINGVMVVRRADVVREVR